jgi:hypothetical protein
LAKRKDVAYDIRPLSFTEVLDRAFALLRDQFWLLAGISAVLWIPYGVLAAFAGTANHLAIRALALLLLLLAPVAHAALTVAVSCVYLGAPATIKGAYVATRDIIQSIIGTYLLMYLLIIPAMIVVLPGIYFINCWLLVAPVMIVEETFGMAALRRSRALVRGRWWSTFALMIVVSLITFIPAMTLEVFWAFIPVLGPVLNGATQAITNGYSLIAVVVYYFDRRCRTEDFDLRILAQRIRTETAAAVPRTSIA